MMKLTKLLGAGIYRDGGSYSADFQTDENLIYSIFLKSSFKSPDKDGLYHKWLFEFINNEMPDFNSGIFTERLPILTGSVQERELVKYLNEFVKQNDEWVFTEESEKYNYQRLLELIYYIPLREPCFAWNVKNYR